MNAKLLLAFSLAGTAYAQANLENNHLDRLSPKVREFVEKYKAEKANKKINDNAQKRKVVLTSDVLGRKVNRGQVQDSTVYVVEDVVEPKMEVTVTDLTVEDVDIEPISAQYSYNGEKKEESFLLNGKKIDKKSFFKKTEDWEKRRIKKQKPLKQSYKAFLTPTEMENKLLSSENVYIENEELIAEPEYVKETDYVGGYGSYNVNCVTFYEALSISQLNHAHFSGYKGDGIGIYHIDEACADVTKIPNSSKYARKECGSGSTRHPTVVGYMLQYFAPDAFIYGYNSDGILDNVPGPNNPSSFSPQIYIGAVPYSVGKGQTHTLEYTALDANMDNYIYTYGVTEFLAAGNYEEGRQSQQSVKSPGKSANAITVGAVDPIQRIYNTGEEGYFYMPLSNYVNSQIGNAKPDITNFGCFYNSVFDRFGYPNDKPYFLGTSAATPFSAAMAADLMAKHPFFKGHPEMVKPVFLTSTLGNTIKSRDTDGGAVPGVPVYDLMASNKSFSGYWRNQRDEQLFKDADGKDKAISFDVNGVTAGEKYKLAVSWLMKGTTIKNLKKLPLNITVSVVQKDKIFLLKVLGMAAASDNKTQNIVLPFTVQNTGKLTVIISRTGNNLAPKDPITIGYHMALQP